MRPFTFPLHLPLGAGVFSLHFFAVVISQVFVGQVESELQGPRIRAAGKEAGCPSSGFWGGGQLSV